MYTFYFRGELILFTREKELDGAHYAQTFFLSQDPNGILKSYIYAKMSTLESELRFHHKIEYP